MKNTYNFNTVMSVENMRESWVTLASRNSAPGIDNISPNIFSRNVDSRLESLFQEITEQRYRPQPLITFPKEKKDHTFRELTIPTLHDKIVAKTIAQNQVQRFNSKLEPQSWAYRPHKNATAAVSCIERTLLNPNIRYAVRIDIQTFFDSINHDILKQTLTEIGNDSQLINLIMLFASNRRFDGIQISSPQIGIPQGTPLAPVISNLYLDTFDKQLNQEHIPFLRFADDIIIFANDVEQAGNFLNQATAILKKLELQPSISKTRIYAIDDGFIFLGFLFTRNGKVPCQEATQRLSEKINSPRYDDETEVEYHKRVDSIVRGWKNYYYFDQKNQNPQINSNDVLPAIDHDNPIEYRESFIDTQKTKSDEDSLDPDFTASTITAPKLDANPLEKTQFRSETTVISQNNSALGFSDSQSNATNSLQQNIDHIDELIATEREQFAIRKISQLLNDDLELPENVIKPLYVKLANLYEKQGLSGAAHRCRKFAGIRTTVKNNYKTTEQLIYGAEHVEQWLDIFSHEGVAYRQYVDRVGRSGYKPASKGLHPAYLRDHWLGKHTLAIPLFDKNNMTRFAVMDFDISRKQLDTMKKEQVDALKITLLDIAYQAGVKGIIEDSGYKGYHVWFFFFERLSGALAQKFLVALNQIAPKVPTGTHRELFPANESLTDDRLNSRIKLPLGMHRLSGKYSTFMKPDGTVSNNGILCLSSRTYFNRAIDLKNAIAEWQKFVPDIAESNTATPNVPNNDIEQLLNSCAVINALKFKAKKSHSLSHYERIVLRGILAPLGANGRRAAHDILKPCNNYSRALTDKMFDAGHDKPMGCSRIKEILSYMVPQLNCNCKFRKTKNDYPNPLRHLNRTTPKNSSTQQPSITKKTLKEITVYESNKAIISQSQTDTDIEVSSQQQTANNNQSPSFLLHIKIGSWKFDVRFTK